MIRGLVLGIGLLLGLGLAVLSEARISHLRLIAGATGITLPAWTRSLAPDAGLMQGQLTKAQTLLWPDAPLPASTLSWKFKGVGRDGLRFDLGLKGEAIALRGGVQLPFFNTQARINRLRGEIGMQPLLVLAQAPDLALSGQIQIDRLQFELDYKTRALLSVTGQMTLYQARFDGTALDTATLVLTPQAQGWRAEISLPEGPLQMALDLQGVWEKTTANLTGRIEENQDMPDGWKRWLNRNIPRKNGGWKIDNILELKGFSLLN